MYDVQFATVCSCSFDFILLAGFCLGNDFRIESIKLQGFDKLIGSIYSATQHQNHILNKTKSFWNNH